MWAPMQKTLDRLDSMKFFELRALWTSTGGIGTQPRLHRRFIAALLGYHMQEIGQGGLAPIVVRRLRAIAGDTGQNPESENLVDVQIKPGTRLHRVWRNEFHEVTALESGFAYRCTTYSNLSVIARLITGTRWSGPAFFGIQQRITRSRKGKRRP